MASQGLAWTSQGLNRACQGLARASLGLAWGPWGLAPSGGGGGYGRTDRRNFSPFYSTLSPTGAAALLHIQFVHPSVRPSISLLVNQS